MKKAVIIFSGGIDSICTCLFLKSKYDLYGISFSYGQRASKEIKVAKSFSKIIGLKKFLQFLFVYSGKMFKGYLDYKIKGR